MKRYYIFYFIMSLIMLVSMSGKLAPNSDAYDIPISQYRLKYDLIHTESHESISSVDSLDGDPGVYAKYNRCVDTIYSTVSSNTDVLYGFNTFHKSCNECDTITYIRRWDKYTGRWDKPIYGDFRYYIVDDTIYYYASYVLSDPENDESPLIKNREKRLVIPNSDKSAFLSENNLEEKRQLQFLYYAGVWSPDSILSMAKDNIGLIYNSISLSRIIVKNDTIRSIHSIEMLDLYGMGLGFTTSTRSGKGVCRMYPWATIELKTSDVQEVPEHIEYRNRPIPIISPRLK